MRQHLYADTLLAPGLGIVFQWRHQNNGQGLLALIDPESPIHGALGSAIERFENTVFELRRDKPSLLDWATSLGTLQDEAAVTELRLGSAHVFQQSIDLLQELQMLTDDTARLAEIHHGIGDVMGFIGQRSGSLHYLEQAALSYQQSLDLLSHGAEPPDRADTGHNLAMAMQVTGLLDDDTGMLKRALAQLKEVLNTLSRTDQPDAWAATMCAVATLLYQLGTHRRGARTLEQALVAYRNALPVYSPDSDRIRSAVTRNNLAATMQALGEHEDDIGSLEACIPVYESVLKMLSAEKMPLVNLMVSANRASAMCALAGESDHLDMAEAAVAEFQLICEQLDSADLAGYLDKAQMKQQQAAGLVSALQV